MKVKIDLLDEKFEDSLARSPMLLKSPMLPHLVRNSATPINQKEFEEESSKLGFKRIETLGGYLEGEDAKSPGGSHRKIAFEENEKRKTVEKRRTSQFVKPLVTVPDNQPLFMYEFEEAANFKQYFKNNNKDQVILKCSLMHKGSRKKNKGKPMKSKNNSGILAALNSQNEIKLVGKNLS